MGFRYFDADIGNLCFSETDPASEDNVLNIEIVYFSVLLRFQRPGFQRLFDVNAETLQIIRHQRVRRPDLSDIILTAFTLTDVLRRQGFIILFCFPGIHTSTCKVRSGRLFFETLAQ